MKKLLLPAAVALLLASAPSYAAPAALPAPIQSVLERIKGEWVVLDKDLLSIRFHLQADGRGQLVDRSGSSEIEWRLDGGKVVIRLLTPTEARNYEYVTDENGNSLEIVSLTALQSLTLEFKKLDGLRGIIWKMTAQSIVSYPDQPEKGTKDLAVVSDNVKLVAGRQLKDFAPRTGQILSLNLPDYQAGVDGSIFDETASLLVRLDAANVATVLNEHPSGLKQLFWTLDQGSLRVSDGKGYTVAYQLYEGEGFSRRLLADAQRPDRQLVSEETSILVNPSLQAQGFQSQSAIFQGCWDALETTYCFKPDRFFSFTAKDDTGEPYSSYGLWRLAEGRLVVDRFYDIDWNPITDTAAMVSCEKELADDTITEKSCQLYQTRSYELLNADAGSIGVYRILKHRDFTQYHAHVFKRAKAQ